MKSIISIIAISLLLIQTGFAQLQVGDSVDDPQYNFDIPNPQGWNTSLFDILDLDQYVLIEFFSYNNAINCDEVGIMNECHSLFSCNNGELFVVGVENLTGLDSDVYNGCGTEREYPYVLGYDASGDALGYDIHAAYQVAASPEYILIGPDKTVIAINEIPDAVTLAPVENLCRGFNSIDCNGNEEGDCRCLPEIEFELADCGQVEFCISGKKCKNYDSYFFSIYADGNLIQSTNGFCDCYTFDYVSGVNYEVLISGIDNAPINPCGSFVNRFEFSCNPEYQIEYFAENFDGNPYALINTNSQDLEWDFGGADYTIYTNMDGEETAYVVLEPCVDIPWQITSESGCCNSGILNYCGFDCEGVDGGSAIPGSDCDDGDDLTENDVYQQDCTCAGTAVAVGCTDPSACNYDSTADADDGSCNLPDCLGNCNGANSGPAIIGAYCGASPCIESSVYDQECDCVPNDNFVIPIDESEYCFDLYNIYFQDYTGPGDVSYYPIYIDNYDPNLNYFVFSTLDGDSWKYNQVLINTSYNGIPGDYAPLYLVQVFHLTQVEFQLNILTIYTMYQVNVIMMISKATILLVTLK